MGGGRTLSLCKREHHASSADRSGARPVDDRSQQFRWWSVRPAQNLTPKNYLCPLCDQYLHAMSEHMLLVPEGDVSRRRHAHTDCVAKARNAGRLPSEDEWRKTQPPPTGRRRRLGRRRV
jgi:hypothetical protein